MCTASCIDTSIWEMLSTLWQLSIVYFDLASNLQQSVFNGALWYNTPIFPAFFPPSNTSRLCSSTNIIPRGQPFVPDAVTITPTSSITIVSIIGPLPAASTTAEGSFYFPPLSSVVVYENTNRSLSMVNALPSLNFVGDPDVATDLFLPFHTEERYPNGVSFSCVYNAPNPIQNASQAALYSRIAAADTGAPPSLFISDRIFLYAIPKQSNDTLPVIRPKPPNDIRMLIDQFLNSNLWKRLTLNLAFWSPVAYGSDITITSLLNNNSVMTYLDNNLNVSLVLIPANSPLYANKSLEYEDPDNFMVNSTVNVPSSLFGAAACSWNSTSHCVYYQYNATALAQAAYDLATREWADTILISA